MSLRLKTIIGIGIIEAILLIILVSTVLQYMRDTSYRDMDNYVKTTTTLFSTATQDAVLSQDLASLDTFVEEILNNQGVLYARIYDSESIILAEGGKPALLHDEILIDTSIEDVDDNVFNAQKNIIIDDEIYGSVNIGFSTGSIEKNLDDAKNMAIIIATIEMVLVAIFSFALGVYLTKQLKVLRKFAMRIADGDLSNTIHIDSHDEVADVADAFNIMTKNLKYSRHQTQQYEQELLTLNQELEHRVQQRTKQLIKKNDELESAYEQLKITQEQLIHSEKLASIGQLAAGVAHEINNPVSFIKGNLNALKSYILSYQTLIQQQQTIIDDHRDYLHEQCIDTIKVLDDFIEEEDIAFIHEDITSLLSDSVQGTERVSDIVKGLKIYSREQGEELLPTNINQCIEETLKIVNNEIKYTCEVVTDLHDPLPMVKGDQGKLCQVLTNLLMNASQAMETKGRITITTCAQEEWITISIKDTGKGISSEHLRQLFDPFFTTKPVGEGTGLGLSISEGIIREHNGTINVASQEGEGTEFVIALPIDEESTT